MRELRGLLSGADHLTWETLATRVAKAAGGLQHLGIGEGDTVAILMRNDAPFLEASLAALRRGAYAVPINWHFKEEEVAYILKDSGARVLVVHSDLWRRVRDAAAPGLSALIVPTPPALCAAYGIADDEARLPTGQVSWDDWVEAQAPSEVPAPPPCESMIYTSGTTGVPKGVRRFRPTPVELAALRALRARVYGFRPGMRALIPGPLYHSAPNAYALNAARMGGLVALMPRFAAEAFLALVERHRISHAFMVPTMFVRLLNLPERVRRHYDVSSLECVVHAAAPCPPEVKGAMIEWWSGALVEFYGATESGPVTFCDSAEWLAHRGTVGRAVEGAVVKVLDEEGCQVPQGREGELYVRVGAYPDFTYQNQPEERRLIEREGLITVGDVGYFDRDGYLYLCDRKRDMIISGGANVYPAEIEAAIHALPGVGDCAVFGIPDAEFGESIMAVIAPAEGAVLRPEQVIAALAARLADYKLPRRVEIRPALPREDSGKIKKRALRDPYWEKTGRRI